MKSAIEEIRERAENDLEFFINLVAPEQVLGQCHCELLDWWTRSDSKSHQLVLFPRDHQRIRGSNSCLHWPSYGANGSPRGGGGASSNGSTSGSGGRGEVRVWVIG